jgi:hypothetical protein
MVDESVLIYNKTMHLSINTKRPMRCIRFLRETGVKPISGLDDGTGCSDHDGLEYATVFTVQVIVG